MAAYLLTAIQLQQRLGLGESFECLRGGLHQRNAHLHAEARGHYGRRWYCSRMPHGKGAICIFMNILESKRKRIREYWANIPSGNELKCTLSPKIIM